MLNVSVANKALIRPSPKSISIVSLIIGNKPEWCIPTPFFNNGKTVFICGNFLSSSDKRSIALLNTSSTSRFSSSMKEILIKIKIRNILLTNQN